MSNSSLTRLLLERIREVRKVISCWQKTLECRQERRRLTCVPPLIYLALGQNHIPTFPACSPAHHRTHLLGNADKPAFESRRATMSDVVNLATVNLDILLLVVKHGLAVHDLLNLRLVRQ